MNERVPVCASSASFALVCVGLVGQRELRNSITQQFRIGMRIAPKGRMYSVGLTQYWTDEMKHHETSTSCGNGG